MMNENKSSGASMAMKATATSGDEAPKAPTPPEIDPWRGATCRARGAGCADPKGPPPKPYTDYTIFFRLERAYIIQTTEGMVDEQALQHDPNHFDPLEHPRPEKYKDLKLPPFWYSSAHKREIEKKRKHRKSEGKALDMQTLSKTISAAWRSENLDPAIPLYCQKLSRAEVEKYHRLTGSIEINIPSSTTKQTLSNRNQANRWELWNGANIVIPDGTMKLMTPTFMHQNMAAMASTAADPLLLPSQSRQSLNGRRSDDGRVYGRNAMTDASDHEQSMIQSYLGPMDKMKVVPPLSSGQNMIVSNGMQASGLASAARLPIATNSSSSVSSNGNSIIPFGAAGTASNLLAAAHQRQNRLEFCDGGMNMETGLGLLARVSKLQAMDQNGPSAEPNFRRFAVPTKRKQQGEEGGRVAASKVARRCNGSVAKLGQSDGELSAEGTDCPSIERSGVEAEAAAVVSPSLDAPITSLEEEKDRVIAMWKEAAIASEEMLQRVIASNREVIASKDRELASMRRSLSIAAQRHAQMKAENGELRAKNNDLELSATSLARVLATKDEEIASLRARLSHDSSTAGQDLGPGCEHTKITSEGGADLEQLSKLGPKVNKKILEKMMLALQDNRKA